ncbi:hypothetical protein [Stratiformator vulcanicus]|uniref:Uncharacterized protein n=1 Tax=Stratiformator vulcanicus TaxID=2527980 RepID=A0A517QYW0_9PLAN|nr:hypothetical protein [Stratiformator vulcanicus]QDT36822.1 hypothetical protein Pan189_11850 [Stratiformator vulcanicus]
MDSLKLSPKITVFPVVHGSGDFAVAVRQQMLETEYDCLAVPLPPSFQANVEEAIQYLPAITSVVQPEPREYHTDWSPESDREDDEEEHACSYVPIDPCQPVIAALRIALQEHIPRRFIDLETSHFAPVTAMLPDAYALKTVRPDRFAAAVLPSLEIVREGQPWDRVVALAARLRELEQDFDSILVVCSILDWPWIKDAYHDGVTQQVFDDDVDDVETFSVAPRTLTFLLGELPFVTSLYERARAELDSDEHLSVDGIKALLLETRDRYRAELKQRARRITPKGLKIYLQYVRNLSLVERRMTPDLYTLAVAARQIFGDAFAVQLMETARDYQFDRETGFATLRMGIDKAAFPDGEVAEMISRLPGPPVVWRSLALNRRPPEIDERQWKQRWNPFSQCSWPPEDESIENLRTAVQDMALAITGDDLARSEKFTTSLMDGLDIRETLRNWHTNDLYVKVFPPNRGTLDCVVMLFDSPADPRDYPWRTTWMAEHQNESTLCFFATDFRSELIGPGIARATYGGAMFLFPPRTVPDIWQDPRFDAVDTLEERLLLAGCFHAKEPYVAVLSETAPGRAFQHIAKRFGKKLVHVPSAKLSQETISQLRTFHVLNGREVRSFASHFIRKP